MEIVNGYICMNCCDVDKARLGQDPQQSTDQLQKQLERHLDKSARPGFGAAVVYGGSLQATTVGNNASVSPSADVINTDDPSQANPKASGLNSSSVSLLA